MMRLRLFKRVKHTARRLGMDGYLTHLYKRLGLQSLRQRIKTRNDQQFQRKYGSVDRFSVTINGQNLLFSTEEEFPKRLLFPRFEGGKIFEEPVTNLLLDSLQDDSCFVDVGTNFGWYACVAAKSAPNRTVFAFDLDDSNVQLTEKNARLNGCNNISVYHCAVSDSVGKIQYRRREGQAADTFQIELNGSLKSPSDIVEVDCITLDAFFRDRPHIPTVVKIDVQGAEFMVLEGMRDLLRDTRPMLLVEIHPKELPKFGKAASDVFHLLKTYGYTFFEVPDLRKHEATFKLREIDISIPLKTTTMVLATGQQEARTIPTRSASEDRRRTSLARRVDMNAKPAIPAWDVEPRHGLRFALTGLVRASALRARNRWFGGSPLKRHVVICGFPRSGTSLLQLMLETATSDARVFGTETRGLKIARRCICNHSTLITKRTNDVFYVDEIRDFYQSTSARPCFVVMIRDPRDVLTSFHASRPNDYYLSCDRWLALYEHYRYVRGCDDVLVVRYEELVSDCEAVQCRLREFADLRTERSFKDFTNAVPEGFLTIGLNGIRPPDTQSVGRWRQPQHRQRLQSVLASLPELPSYLIDMNYEPDIAWANEYLGAEIDQQQPAAK